MDQLDLFPAAGLRFISVRHEQNATLMAEGHARAGRGIGVCIGQNGLGVTDLVTGVAQAIANHAPLVVMNPAITSASIGTYAIQEVDQMPLLAPIVKDQFQVNRLDKIAWAMRNALWNRTAETHFGRPFGTCRGIEVGRVRDRREGADGVGRRKVRPPYAWMMGDEPLEIHRSAVGLLQGGIASQ